MHISLRYLKNIKEIYRLLTPINILLGTMLLLGVWLRIRNFTEPYAFIFDENHFVGCARQYLAHQGDWNDHPPLGKLIIAFAMNIFGDNPLGWRISSLFWGLFTVVIGGIACARLFKNSLAGWMAAAFLSVDGLMVTYSRVAHLDIYLAAAAAVTILITTMPLTYLSALVGGMVLGGAVGVKFSGICLLLPFMVCFSFAKIPRRKLALIVSVLIGTCILIYIVQYLIGLYLSGQPTSVGEVFVHSKRLFEIHSKATAWKNPWLSDWFTWAIPVRTIPLMFTKMMDEIRVLSGLSNVVLSWTGAGVTLIALITISARGIITTAAPQTSEVYAGSASNSVVNFVRLHGCPVLLLVAGCVGFLAPWMLSHRVSYLWHFIPSYLFIVILPAGYFGWLHRRMPRVSLLYAALVLIAAAYFAPVWTFAPISESEMNIRLFWSGWR